MYKVWGFQSLYYSKLECLCYISRKILFWKCFFHISQPQFWLDRTIYQAHTSLHSSKICYLSLYSECYQTKKCLLPPSHPYSDRISSWLFESLHMKHLVNEVRWITMCYYLVLCWKCHLLFLLYLMQKYNFLWLSVDFLSKFPHHLQRHDFL